MYPTSTVNSVGRTYTGLCVISVCNLSAYVGFPILKSLTFSSALQKHVCEFPRDE